MSHEQMQEMIESFSKVTTLISSATSKEDMLVIGMVSIPMIEAHRQMAVRLKSVIDEENSKEVLTPVSNTMS